MRQRGKFLWGRPQNGIRYPAEGHAVQTSDLLDRWWPLQRALYVVHAPVDVVASAVLAEVTRFVAGDPLSARWIPFASLGDVFGSVPLFTNVPTVFFVLPTKSDWSVLWNNSFLCDGYDSLCHCLTLNHGQTTFHWQASDESAVFQAGTSFTFRRRVSDAVSERSVYCCRNDRKWEFGTVGEPLPEEDLSRYTMRAVRRRLDEAGMIELLARLGVRPRENDFYRSGEASVWTGHHIQSVFRRNAFPRLLVHDGRRADNHALQRTGRAERSL